MSVCAKQLAAAWGKTTVAKAAGSCPKEPEEKQSEDEPASLRGGRGLPKLVGHEDPRSADLERLLSRLSSLEHSLERALGIARDNPISMAVSRAACANLELLQAEAYAVSTAITDHVFGGSPFGSRLPPAGGPPRVTVPYASLPRPPVAGQPLFAEWARARLELQGEQARARSAQLRAEDALVPPIVPGSNARGKNGDGNDDDDDDGSADGNGDGDEDANVDGGDGGGDDDDDSHDDAEDQEGAGGDDGEEGTDAGVWVHPRRVRAERRARQILERAARYHPRHVDLHSALARGQLLGPGVVPDDSGLALELPFATWQQAFAWAGGSLAELTVPDATSEARAADLLGYHVPRVCAVLECAQKPLRPFNFTVLGPSSGDALGWLECPFCPPQPAAVLFAGDRTGQSFPADASTGQPQYKHPGLDDAIDSLRGFCRKVLPYDAKVLSEGAESLVRALEAAERSLHDEAGLGTVVAAVTTAAESAARLPQAPEPKDDKA